MTKLDRGDVVLVDLGMAGKTRPCVGVPTRQPDHQRNRAVVVPMTTAIRGGECEVSFPKPPWLHQASVVNVLGIAGVDTAKIVRRIAPFPKDSFSEVMDATMQRLALESENPLQKMKGGRPSTGSTTGSLGFRCANR